MGSEADIVGAILRQNEFLFRRHLVLSNTVLEQMKSNGLITEVTRRKIMMEPSHRQVPTLINALQHKGFHSLRKFMDVLKNTGHSWIVDRILDTDVNMAGQGRSKDDIGYKDRYKPAYTRPQASIIEPTLRRTRYDPLKPDPRKSITAAAPYYSSQPGNGHSLGELLKAREPPDPETEPRGIIHARTLFSDPIAVGPAAGPAPFSISSYPLTSGPFYNPGRNAPGRYLPGLPSYGQQHPLGYPPNTTEEIPGTLYGLNQAFADEDQKNKQVMSVLRQEEIAIKQLMEQNARDQGHVRRKQAAVDDIVHRLRDIHNRAKEVYEPSPHPNIGRYRLAQLNQIPWNIDN